MIKIIESKSQEKKIASSLLPVLIELNKEAEKNKLEKEKPEQITPDMIDLIIQQQLS